MKEEDKVKRRKVRGLRKKMLRQSLQLQSSGINTFVS